MMDVIFKFMILFGVVELGFGIASTCRGYDVLASIRPAGPPSAFAGVHEFVAGAALIAIGAVASYAWNKSKSSD
jgi:hypothetical protein